MTPEDKRYAAMFAAGLVEPDIIQVGQEMRWDWPKRLHVKRKRRPSLARMARLARKLGLDVEVSRDGLMTLKASEPSSKSEAVNPWDEVL